MKKRRILQLIGSFEIGGSEAQAVKLSKNLSGLKAWDVRVACLDDRGPLKDQLERFGTIECFPLSSFYDANFLRQARRLAAYIRSEQIELVHSHDFYTNILGMVGSSLTTARRVASKRETHSKTRKQLFAERQAFRFAHKIVANSDAVREFLTERGVPDAKIVTIYNGIDPNCLVPRAGAERSARMSLRSLDVAPETKLVTIVANMRSNVKNHELFLRSAKLVSSDFENATFVLVGEGELEEQYRKLADDLGIGTRCRFLGPRSDVREILAVSDIGVLCSRSEGFSNAILEYMAAGLPVVATDVGGAREAVMSDKTGFVIPSGDEKALAAAILSLLENATLAENMGASGRALAGERFSESAQIDAVMTLYESLLDQ